MSTAPTTPATPQRRCERDTQALRRVRIRLRSISFKRCCRVYTQLKRSSFRWCARYGYDRLTSHILTQEPPKPKRILIRSLAFVRVNTISSSSWLPPPSPSSSSLPQCTFPMFRGSRLVQCETVEEQIHNNSLALRSRFSCTTHFRWSSSFWTTLSLSSASKQQQQQQQSKEPFKSIIISHYLGFPSFVSLPLDWEIPIESRCFFIKKCWKKNLCRNFLCILSWQCVTCNRTQAPCISWTSLRDTWWWELNWI